MNKISLFLVLVCLPLSPLYARIKLPQLPCPGEIEKVLKGWSTKTHQWTARPMPSLDGSLSYHAPTSEFGVWATVIRKGSNNIELIRSTSHTTLTVEIESPQCQAKMNSQANSEKFPEGLSEPQIAEFVKNNQRGLIFVWSPQMQLSYSSLTAIEKVSKELKLPLLVGVDPSVGDKELLVAKDKYQVSESYRRRVYSHELTMRHMNDHFPVLYIFNNGKMIDFRHPGAENETEYTLIIKNHLGI